MSLWNNTKDEKGSPEMLFFAEYGYFFSKIHIKPWEGVNSTLLYIAETAGGTKISRDKNFAHFFAKKYKE